MKLEIEYICCPICGALYVKGVVPDWQCEHVYFSWNKKDFRWEMRLGLVFKNKLSSIKKELKTSLEEKVSEFNLELTKEEET